MSYKGIHMFTRLWLLITFIALAACGGGGGGGGGGSNTPPAPAPSGLSYSPAASTFVVGYSINPLTPAVSGTVTSYTVNPALPAGLSINATTGAISGTPTTVTAAASYVVTATNSSGSATTNVAIAVTQAAPAISYERSQLTLTTGVMFTMGVINTGGPATSWSIHPALPDGFALNITNGTLTGAPRVTSPNTQYVVTATNSGGTSTFNISVRIDSGVLLDLGHAANITQLRQDGNRVLSLDSEGRWALWNADTTALIASGNAPCQSVSECGGRIELAGGIFAVGNANLVQMFAASDGRLLTGVPVPITWWKLASDGSYIARGNDQSLSAWSPAGTMVFSRPGNYAQADAYAAAGEIRVANGAAGVNVIEKVAVPTGAATSSPAHLGTFHSWFIDGERFLTNVSGTVRVYGLDSQLQDTRVLAFLKLVGQGDRFWVSNGSQLSIYAVGASATPLATFAADGTLIPSRMTIGALDNSLSFSVIDLASVTPTKIDIATNSFSPSAYAARSDAGWLVGNSQGVVVDATNLPTSPKYYGHGRLRDLATGGNRIVLVTSVKPITFFDATTREQEGQLSNDTARSFGLSDDGTVLATGVATGLQIIALPSGAEIQTVPNPVETLWNYTLSGSGQVLGRVSGAYRPNFMTFHREAIAIGGQVLWSEDTCCYPHAGGLQLHLSPSGNHIAVSNGELSSNPLTTLIVNGTPVFQLPGQALDWLDENRLLVSRGSFLDIVSPTGQVVRTVRMSLTIPSFRPVDANRIYSPARNMIFSLDDGSIVWQSDSPTRGIGDVTATHVVFASGGTVRMEPY